MSCCFGNFEENMDQSQTHLDVTLKVHVQLNEYEADSYFLQNFQSNTTVCLIIREFCQSCDPEVVQQIKTKSDPRM